MLEAWEVAVNLCGLHAFDLEIVNECKLQVSEWCPFFSIKLFLFIYSAVLTPEEQFLGR